MVRSSTNAAALRLTMFGSSSPKAVGGLVFIEYVVSYPGAGLTLQQAALGNDYPLTQGLLLVFALCVIAANFVMDLLNVILDPRVRAS
jgi:peptide/nickel transport system permease protein